MDDKAPLSSSHVSDQANATPGSTAKSNVHLTTEEILEFLRASPAALEGSALQDRIYRHIADCRTCRDVFVIAHRIENEDEPVELPEFTPEDKERVLALIFDVADRTLPPLLEFPVNPGIAETFTDQEDEDWEWAIAAQNQALPGWPLELSLSTEMGATTVHLLFEIEDLWVTARLSGESPVHSVTIVSPIFKAPVTLNRGGKGKLVGDLEEMGLSEESSAEQIRTALGPVEVKHANNH